MSLHQSHQCNLIKNARCPLYCCALLIVVLVSNKSAVLFCFFFKSALSVLSIAKTKQIYTLQAFGVMNE